MKKIILVAVFALVTVSSFGQNISGQCYRAFADVGYTVGIPYNGDWALDRIEVTTSHGYQVTPIIFVGAGVGAQYSFSYDDGILFSRKEKVSIPVFANVRVNCMKTKVVPFVDVKAGTLVNEKWGYYVNGSLGCRIATNTRSAINVLVGFSAEDLQIYDSHFRENDSNVFYGLSIKVGYEF